MITYLKHKFNFKFPVSDTDNFTDIKLVKFTAKNSKRKVLYVLDYIPKEDLESRTNLLSGSALDTFANLLKLAKVPDHNYLVCSYHACRTIGQMSGFVNSAFEAFDERLYEIIQAYQPDSIIVFGHRPFKVICRKESEMANENPHNIIGCKFERTFGYNGNKPVTVVKSIPIDGIFAGNEGAISLSGYIARHIDCAYNQNMRYKIERPKLVVVLIDNIKRFKKFFAMLLQEPIVSIDTETDNLYRVKNRVLTIQFSFDTEYSYIIPLCHKDSTFSKNELDYIFDTLRDYFESTSVAECHIFANAQFDLNVMRTQFGIRYYKTPIFDIFSSECVLDENMKWLQTMAGGYYYSLGNLASQYGDYAYLTAKFSKAERATIKNHDLDEDLLNYCLSRDCIVLTNSGYVPILDIKIGDLVQSYNHKTNTCELKEVSNTSSHITSETMLEVDYGFGKIKVTENHKVWSVTRNSYIRAVDIVENEELLVEMFDDISALL